MKRFGMWCGALLALLGAMTSCEKALKNAPASLAEIQKPSSELAVIQVDSVRVDSTWKFHDPDLSEYGDCPPSFSCVMDVPSFDQAPILANAVMEWVNEECLRGTYSGDVTQVKQMLEAVMRSESDEDVVVNYNIRKVYENACVITFVCTCDMFAYGAHGMETFTGATFRKSDGKRFGWNMFRLAADLQTCLRGGLEKYFETKDSAALADELFLDEVHSIDDLPRPLTEPWLEADGIQLLYQSYEIASYADGQPLVTIPVKDAESLLTPTAYSLFK